MQESRQRVLDLVLIINAGMSLLLLIMLFVVELRKPETVWGFIFLDLVIFSGIVLLAVMRDIPYNIRAGILLGLYYIFALIGMLTYGLDINIGVATFVFVIMAFLFSGLWVGLFALVLSVFTLGTVGWLIQTGQYTVTIAIMPGTDILQIVLMVIGFSYGVGVIVAALLRQQRDTFTVFDRVQDLTVELEQERLSLAQRVAERTRDLEISAQVSRRLSTILDKDQLVQEVVDQVRAAFDYYHVHIYLYDESRSRLVLVSGTGAAGKEMLARGHSIEAGKGLVGRAAESGEPVIVPEVNQAPVWLPNPLLPRTRSEVAAPIKFHNEVLGVLDVQDDVAGGLDEEDAYVLQMVANQIAIAIRNARLYAETQRRAENMALINRVVSAVAASLNLRQNMQIIVEELAKAINVEQVGIALLNPEGTGLTVVAEQYDPAVSPSAVGFVIPLEGNIATQRVIDSRETLIVEDASTSEMTVTAHEVLQQRGVKTLIIMPIVVGNEVVGTLGIDLLKDDEIVTPEQLGLAETLVYQAATAVQTTRLFERTQAALAETESLYVSSAELNRAQSFDDILQVIRDYTELGQSADILNIIYFDKPWIGDQVPEYLDILAQWDAQPRVDFVERYLTAGIPRFNLLTADEPFVVEDTRHDPRLDDESRALFAAPRNLESVIFVPLIVRSRWIGLVGVYYRKPMRFAESEVRRLVSLVGQAAVASQTLVLLEETQTALTKQAYLSAQLRTVSEVGTAVSTILEIDTLLQSVVELTKERFNLYHAHIFLLERTTNMLILKAGAGEIDHIKMLEGVRIGLHETSIVARAARSCEAVVVNDTQNSDDFLAHPLIPLTRSELAVPIIAGNHLFGVLDVQADSINRFTPNDVQVQMALASQVAVAVQNANLYAEQVQTAQKLREVDILKTDFLASMSHELRTPLNSIIGFADVLLAGIDGDLNARMEEDIRIIRNSGNHLRDLIGGILDMSKIEAGRMELKYEEIEIAHLVGEVVSSARLSAEEKGLDLQYHLDDSVSTIVADRTRIGQVLWNIVGNAIKFTDKGGINISARMEGNTALFYIRDTGIGIHQEDIPVVFEQFRQIDTSNTNKQGGTGLGMPISKRLVELHGGTIGLESKLGQGTTFWFTLPREPNGISERGD